MFEGHTLALWTVLWPRSQQGPPCVLMIFVPLEWTQVSGAVREVTGYTATFRHIMSVEEGGEEGDCLHIRQGFHHTVKGFPNCVIADATINFFMARTQKLQQVGFDPHLSRSGHLGEHLHCRGVCLFVFPGILFRGESGQILTADR